MLDEDGSVKMSSALLASCTLNDMYNLMLEEKLSDSLGVCDDVVTPRATLISLMKKDASRFVLCVHPGR